MNKKKFIKNTYYKAWEAKNKTETEDDYYSLIFNLFNTLEITNAFEVAIGDGKPFAQKLSEKIIVDGIDLSDQLVMIANQNKNINATYGDAEIYEIGNYDLIYCLRSFWYFDQWKIVLRNIIKSSKKYVIFDVLNGENKVLIYDEINFRHTLIGKLYVAFKNTIKYILNITLSKPKYYMQTLTPIESYHIHDEIVRYINQLVGEDKIQIEFFGIVTQTKNYIDNEKDYRIIYKLTKKEKNNGHD